MEIIEEENQLQEHAAQVPWVSFLLISINLLVFICMVVFGIPFFEPAGQHILDWGGTSCETLLDGGWWRLFTSLFVHFGILHLGMNMYMLFRIGPQLEVIVGKLNFITIYLVTGIFGGLLSQLCHLNSYCVEAGASGAIFGVIGALTALLSTNLFPEEVRTPQLKQMGILICVNIVYGLQAPNVALAAHMGGLFIGLVFGYGFYRLLSIKSGELITRSLAVFATALAILGTFSSIKRSDAFQFDAITAEILSLEQVLQELHQKQPSSQMEFILFWTDKIMPEMDKLMALSQKANSLSLSQDKAHHRDYLVRWISLSHQKCRLIIPALTEETDTYLSQIETISQQIDNLSDNFEKDKLAK